MPKQVGFMKLKGNLDGVSFYQKNGESFARKAIGPSKAMIEKSPKFKEFRDNRREFTGSLQTVRALRKTLNAAERTMFDPSFAVRAGKIFRLITNRHDDARGKRPIESKLQADLFKEFDLHAEREFGKVFNVLGITTAIDAARTTVTLTVPAFSIDKAVAVPELTTHFRLINLCGVMSAYAYNEEMKKYMPVDKDNDTLYAVAYSDYLPIKGDSNAITIAATLSTVANLGTDSAILSAIGIQFFDQRGTKYHSTSKNGSMRILKLF